MKRRMFLFSLAFVILAGIGVFCFFPRHKPHYCWLVFGPDARVRVLVRMDGEATSLDHYANGKPTGHKELFRNPAECKNIILDDPDGKTSYVITGMRGTIANSDVPTELFVNVDIKGPINYRQYCDVVKMAGNLGTAPLACFNAPLTVEVRKTYWKLPPGLSLQRGHKPTDVFAHIGTMDAQKGCWVVVRTQDGNNQPTFPKGIHPFVDVEFPPQNKRDPPIKRRYPLEEVC